VNLITQYIAAVSFVARVKGGGSSSGPSKRWTNEFLEVDKDSEEWKNRHMMEEGKECTPSDETMNRLPGIDTVEDQKLILGPLWKLTARFFFIMFPRHVFQYILDKVKS